MSAKASASAGTVDADDVVATWKVPLKGKIYTVVFEHGSVLTGKRVIHVNGTAVVRKEFMFNLVGKEPFRLGPNNTKCQVSIETNSGWEMKYTLIVDGKPLDSHLRESKKTSRTWLPVVTGTVRRVVFEVGDMEVYVDGKRIETTGEFLEADDADTAGATSGSAHNFIIDDTVQCYVKIYSSGNRFDGLLYDLYVHEQKIERADLNKVLAAQRPDEG